MNREALKDRPTAELVDAMDQLQGLTSAAHASLLKMITAYDEREAWREDGAASMEAWLCYRYGISSRTAAAWVEAARALKALPAVERAYSEGSMLFAKRIRVCRIGTRAAEGELAKVAVHVGVLGAEG